MPSDRQVEKAPYHVTFCKADAENATERESFDETNSLGMRMTDISSYNLQIGIDTQEIRYL